MQPFGLAFPPHTAAGFIAAAMAIHLVTANAVMVATALVHDVGKVMYLWGDEDDGQGRRAQWGITGDTWAVNRPFPADAVVYPEYEAATEAATEGAGGALEPCFGHDEYLYQVLVRNRCTTLPAQALAMVRYHSCYPWHARGAYVGTETAGQRRLLPWVRLFNGFDLYSKAREPEDEDRLWFYDALLDEFFPDPLVW